jgi:hypothetical protein
VPKEVVSKLVTTSSRLLSTNGHKSQVVVGDEQLMELDETVAVYMECLGYNATVEVIGRLLPKQDRNVMVLTLKCLCKSNPFLGNH